MSRLFFLLLLSVLSFSNVFAQADSIRPTSATSGPAQSAQDTGAPVRHTVHKDSVSRHDSSVRHTLSPRMDSIRRHAASVRADSLLAAGLVHRDSTGRIDTLAKHDSLSAVAAVPPVAVKATVPVVKPVGETGQLHQSESKDSLFYLMLGILFYFALIRIFFEKYFGNLMTLFFRVSLRQQQIREQVLQAPLPSLLLNILFIITGGLYAAFLLHYSRFGEHINFWLLYLDCIAGLMVVYLVKFLVLKFSGWVFNISRATDTYIFVVFLVNKMVAIFLLPFLIVITFSGPEMREIFITLSLIMVLVLVTYRVLAAYRPVRNEIKLTPFHFFLYLCAFEIAPLLLIYKVLLSYLEKVY